MSGPQGTQPRSLVLHPFLFVLSPILFLYTFNLSQLPLRPGELVLPSLVALAGTGVLLLLLRLILRDGMKAGLLTTLVVVLVFSYGHVYQAMSLGLSGHGYLLGVWLLLLALGLLLVLRARRRLTGLTTVLNLVAAAALATNLVTGLPALLRRPGPAKHPAAARPASRPADYPDIYYIILDAYTRSDVMQAFYGYDNSEFITFLERNGFHVARRARSNYAQTYLSLASSLNFTHLDSIARLLGPESKDRRPLVELIGNSRVTRFLKEHGYTIVSIESGYSFTDLANADVRLTPRRGLSEFQNVLLATTVIPPLLSLGRRSEQGDRHRERTRFTLNSIPRAAEGRRPAFVFAHIMCPHMPFVFGAEGEPIKVAGTFQLDDMDGGDGSRATTRPLYLKYYGPQARYLTKLVTEMVTRLLAESPAEPVIIIQGDHGTGASVNLQREPARLTERHAILNAIRIPMKAQASSLKLQARRQTAGSESTNDQAPMTNDRSPDSAIRIPHSELLYDSLTPVNTFRLVFNALFDTTFPLLPDKSYYSATRPYKFYDIDSLGAPATVTGPGDRR